MKTKEEKTSLWLALLEFRNSPIKNSNLTPSQILMGRQTRTLVPAKTTMFMNKLNENVKSVIKHNNKNNKKYHDRNSKSKQKFEKGGRCGSKMKNVGNQLRL